LLVGLGLGVGGMIGLDVVLPLFGLPQPQPLVTVFIVL